MKTITRDDVIARMWELACTPASETKDSLSAQVRAVAELAEVLGMKMPRVAGLSREFEGKSSEEQEFFAVHGYWPEQSMGAGKPRATASAPHRAAQRPEKSRTARRT